jgi:hypothetical protein
MKHGDFWIGDRFWCGGLSWRCTDVGTRTIAAILLDRVDVENSQSDEVRSLGGAEAAAEGWFDGPPYAVAEQVFDEDDMEDCTDVPPGQAAKDRSNAASTTQGG